MARGEWSFLHEWVIYDYLMERFHDRTLRLKCKVKSGKLNRRESWVKVSFLAPISTTDFPDIKGILLSDNNTIRPAEVKFTTHLFNYHKATQYDIKYNEFIINQGFILVLSHDYLPSGLEDSNIDIYEIDKTDFISFCRENFYRLLNRQIRTHTDTKVWIMYQGPNFNTSTKEVLSARESGIWCPTENLSGFDLANGDRILFVKTSGSSTQDVQRNYLKNSIENKWLLNEIWVGEITSTIYSRYEYCQIKNIDYTTQLWSNDPRKGNEWRWNRVFSFKQIKDINKNCKMDGLYKDEATRPFVDTIIEAFCFNKSREISLQEYRDILEKII